MAIIYNYPLNSILLAEDMLIGTSTNIVNGQPKNATKNFSIADLTGFIKQNVPLNDVLLAGNTSLLDAKVGGLYLYDTPVAGYGNIVLNQNRFSFNTVTHGEVFRAQRDMFSSFSSSGYRGSFEVSSITANRVWDLPNKSGTVALLSDISTSLIGEITIDSYIGSRLRPTNPLSNGFYVDRNVNGAVGFTAINQNTGNGAISIIDVGIGALYTQTAYIAKFSSNYYVPLLAGKGGLLGTEEVFVGSTDGNDVSILTGPAFPSITRKFTVKANGQLLIQTTPTTGATSDKLLVRDTSGNVKQISYPTIPSIPTLQEVLDEGDVAVDSAIFFSNTANDFETSVNEFGDGQIILKSVVNDTLTNIGAGQVYLGTIDGTDNAIINKDGIIVNAVNYAFPSGASSPLATLDDITGGVTSVGLTMPSAFTVTNSPITSSGDIAVTGAGLVSQYVRGDGTLANFPASTGGGASVSYYLNGSVSQGTIGGVAYKEINGVPVIGAGTDFTINADGYIQSFITDAGDPNKLLIPAGNWNFETYFSASSGGGSPRFYIELYKYDGTTFTLIASNSATPEYITGGTSIDLYFTALAVPSTVLLATDRLAVRFYVIHSGRTIKMHTENSHLSQIITTFSSGLTALNGLTDQVQYFNVGTGAANLNIVSSGNTHTFNLLSNIRRNANNSSNNNINYNGYAVTGSAESSAVWTITRLTIAASGSITIATATNVAWTNRESATYI